MPSHYKGNNPYEHYEHMLADADTTELDSLSQILSSGIPGMVGNAFGAPDSTSVVMPDVPTIEGDSTSTVPLDTKEEIEVPDGNVNLSDNTNPILPTSENLTDNSLAPITDEEIVESNDNPLTIEDTNKLNQVNGEPISTTLNQSSVTPFLDPNEDILIGPENQDAVTNALSGDGMESISTSTSATSEPFTIDTTGGEFNESNVPRDANGVPTQSYTNKDGILIMPPPNYKTIGMENNIDYDATTPGVQAEGEGIDVDDSMPGTQPPPAAHVSFPTPQWDAESGTLKMPETKNPFLSHGENMLKDIMSGNDSGGQTNVGMNMDNFEFVDGRLQPKYTRSVVDTDESSDTYGEHRWLPKFDADGNIVQRPDMLERYQQDNPIPTPTLDSPEPFEPGPTLRSNLELPKGFNRNRLYKTDDGRTMHKRFLRPDEDVTQQLEDWNKGTDLGKYESLENGRVVTDTMQEILDTPQDQQELDQAEFEKLSLEDQTQLIKDRKAKIQDRLDQEEIEALTAPTDSQEIEQAQFETLPLDQQTKIIQDRKDKIMEQYNKDNPPETLAGDTSSEEAEVNQVVESLQNPEGAPPKEPKTKIGKWIKDKWNWAKEYQKTPEGQAYFGNLAKIFANFHEGQTGQEKGTSWQSALSDLAVKSGSERSGKDLINQTKNDAQNQTSPLDDAPARDINLTTYANASLEELNSLLDAKVLNKAEYQQLVSNLQNKGENK